MGDLEPDGARLVRPGLLCQVDLPDDTAFVVERFEVDLVSFEIDRFAEAHACEQDEREKWRDGGVAQRRSFFA